MNYALGRAAALDGKDIEIAKLRQMVECSFREGWRYGAQWDFTKEWGEQAWNDWGGSQARQMLDAGREGPFLALAQSREMVG